MMNILPVRREAGQFRTLKWANFYEENGSLRELTHVFTTARKFARRPESTDPSWTAFKIGRYVIAFRVFG